MLFSYIAERYSWMNMHDFYIYQTHTYLILWRLCILPCLFVFISIALYLNFLFICVEKRIFNKKLWEWYFLSKPCFTWWHFLVVDAIKRDFEGCGNIHVQFLRESSINSDDISKLPSYRQNLRYILAPDAVVSRGTNGIFLGFDILQCQSIDRVWEKNLCVNKCMIIDGGYNFFGVKFIPCLIT